MAREQFQTLTEPMYYILLALTQECCGVDIMDRVRQISNGRIKVGPGTLYAMLSKFEAVKDEYRDIRFDGSLLSGEDEKALIMAIAGYPEAVRKAALTYDPSVIAALLYDIAKTFSHYYHDNQVLKAETRELVAARIGLSEMVLQTLSAFRS